MQQALSKGIEPLFATVSARILHSSWYEGMLHLLQLLKGLVRKETVVIRRWGKGVGITRENLILSTELIIQIGHRKEFLQLMFRALRRFVPSSVSSFVPTKEQR